MALNETLRAHYFT